MFDFVQVPLRQLVERCLVEWELVFSLFSNNYLKECLIQQTYNQIESFAQCDVWFGHAVKNKCSIRTYISSKAF